MGPETLKTFGQQLQRLRDAADASQLQLAKAAGVPVATIRNFEQGRRLPRLDTTVLIARTLRVSLDELIGDVFNDLAPVAALNDVPRRLRGRPRKNTTMSVVGAGRRPKKTRRRKGN